MSALRQCWLACSFFICLAAIPLLDFALPAAGVTPSGRRYSPVKVAISWNKLIQGDAVGELESAIKSRSFLVHETGARFNELMFLALGRTTGLHVSADNWLFVKERTLEIESEDLDCRIDHAVRVVEEFSERCAERNLKLFVVITPDRFRLYPQRVFSDGVLPENRGRFLPELCTALRERGLPVLDLTPAFLHEVQSGRELHFSVDHHWTYAGSEVGAQYCARWLESEIGVLPGAKSRTFVFREKLVDGSPHRSLVTLLKLRKERGIERRFLSEQRVVDIVPSWPELNQVTWDPEDEPSGIVLQSSFGMFGFPQYLEKALDRRLVALVQPGRGSLYGPSRFLLDHLPKLGESNPYLFVLWEIPEYHLFDGLEEQNLSKPAGLPHPFLDQEIAQLRHIGLRADEVRVASRKCRMNARFETEVDLVRIKAAVSGASNRGRIAVGDQTSLVLTDFTGAHAYDFRLKRPAKSITIDWEFRTSGVVLSEVEVVAGLNAKLQLESERP